MPTSHLQQMPYRFARCAHQHGNNLSQFSRGQLCTPTVTELRCLDARFRYSEVMPVEGDPYASYLCPRSAPSRSAGCSRQVHNGLWQMSSQRRTRPRPELVTSTLAVTTRKVSGITALSIDPSVSIGGTSFAGIRPRSALILVDAGSFG